MDESLWQLLKRGNHSKLDVRHSINRLRQILPGIYVAHYRPFRMNSLFHIVPEHLPVWGALLILSCVNAAHSAPISIYWEGTISAVTAFSDGDLPAGSNVGGSISGSLIFDQTASIQHRHVVGTYVSGEEYLFSDSCLQTIEIGETQWSIIGSQLSLSHYSEIPEISFPENIVFDAFSTSENSIIEDFPNFFETYALGFALYDQQAPLRLFDSFAIEEFTFDLSEFSTGSGSLSSNARDANGDIVGGFYVEFSIETVSPFPIPEPTPGLYLLSSACGVLFVRRRVIPWQGWSDPIAGQDAIRDR